jgi:hypothetical protein
MPSPLHTFAPGTVISSSEVNENFLLLEDCLANTGGEISGAITPNAENTIDLGTQFRSFRTMYTNSLRLMDTDRTHYNSVVLGNDLTSNRTLTIITGDADRTLTINSDVTLGGQNVFTTVAVSGQSNVVADSATDTLTLAAGSGISITTNAATDTITFTATGGGGNVSSTGTFAADNRLIRSDGTSRNIQASDITVDDSDNVSGITNLSYDTASVLSHNVRARDVIYQAASDGFVIVYGTESAGNSSVEIRTDAAATPTTVRGGWTIAVTSNLGATATVPVKKGDYYTVVTTLDGGGLTTTVNWVPFGLNG